MGCDKPGGQLLVICYLTWSGLVCVWLGCAAGWTVTPVWLEPLWLFWCVVTGPTCRTEKLTVRRLILLQLAEGTRQTLTVSTSSVCERASVKTAEDGGKAINQSAKQTETIIWARLSAHNFTAIPPRSCGDIPRSPDGSDGPTKSKHFPV